MKSKRSVIAEVKFYKSGKRKGQMRSVSAWIEGVEGREYTADEMRELDLVLACAARDMAQTHLEAEARKEATLQ